MTTAYTSLLGLALPVTGELQGTWGDTVNNSITSLLDTAVAGTTTLSTDGDVTLTTTTGATNQARQAIILCSGARTALRTITAPAQSKIYTIINATTGGYAVKIVGVGPTTGVTIAAGASAQVAWNGSDFVEVGAVTAGNFTITGSLTLSAGTANGVAYLNGSKVLTTGSALYFDGTNLGIGATSNLAKLTVGQGSTPVSGEIARFNTANVNAPGVTISNWTGSATTQGPRIAFDNSGFSSWYVGASNALNTFQISATWGTPVLYLYNTGAVSTRLDLTAGTQGWNACTHALNDSSLGVKLYGNGTKAATAAISLARSNITNASTGDDYADGVGIQIGGFYQNNGGRMPIYFGTGYDLPTPLMTLTTTGQLELSTRASAVASTIGFDQPGIYSAAVGIPSGVAALAFYGYNGSARYEQGRFSSSGYFGINTQSPRSILTVSETVDGDGITLNHAARATNTYWLMSLSGTVNQSLAFSQYNGSSLYSSYIPGRDSHYWYVNNGLIGAFNSSGDFSQGGNMNVLEGTNVLHQLTGEQGTTYVKAISFGVLGTSGIAYNGAWRWYTSTGNSGVYKNGFNLQLRVYDGGSAAEATSATVTYQTWYQGNNSSTWSTTSDARVKTNIRPISGALAKICALNACHFEMKNELGVTKTNFIAQEFEQVFPGHVAEVTTPEDLKDFTDSPTIKTIDPNLIPYLCAAIKEQQAIIDQLKADVAALKGN